MWMPVHPCVRGERSTESSEGMNTRGSSLRTRGTGRAKAEGRDPARFIPAYAGNGKDLQRRGWRDSVHPCVRGERAWEWGPVGRPDRFIPAYAGNGLTMGRNPASPPVHPCVRGERALPVQLLFPGFGSSLRTRGTGIGQARHEIRDRFIPAYAGNGPWPARRRRSASVHPCVRGERPRDAHGSAFEVGSSLRTRGTAVPDVHRWRAVRFIPAYAGNGAHLSRRPLRSTVHPCVRGERAATRAAVEPPAGSSLRTRGTEDLP